MNRKPSASRRNPSAPAPVPLYAVDPSCPAGLTATLHPALAGSLDPDALHVIARILRVHTTRRSP
jgi:hypothetical protein